MKILYLFCLIILFQSAKAQNETFEQQWKQTLNYVSGLDSSCSILKKHKSKLAKRRYKATYISDSGIIHRVIVSYKNGNIISTHIYRNGGGKRIKILYVNEKIVLLEMNWKNYADKISIKNRFIKLHENLWHWEFEKNTRTNDVKIFKKIAKHD
jgi:hypothetical protein